MLSKKKESENLNNIRQRIKSDYKIFNPCYQKEKISQIFDEYRRKRLLTDSQFKEIMDKVHLLNDLDLYKLQQKMRIPKLMTFEEKKITSEYLYDNNYKPIYNEEKEKLYFLLMQLGFISYLEEGNVLKPKKIEPIPLPNESINSISLRSLSMQENLSNSDSGYFTTFEDKKNGLIMAYVDNERNIKIFDVFHKQVLNDVKDLKHTKKIVCVDYYKINEVTYLISIALDNTMIISDLSINEKDTSKIIENIGDTFNKHQAEPNNTFCLSTVRNQGHMWIITSYYYDGTFKIFNMNGDFIRVVDNKDYIISLEGLYYTEENTYICVRSPRSINLFINEFYIKTIMTLDESFHTNFKIIKALDYYIETYYIIITIINKDLSSYNIQIFDISPIFPLFTKLSEFLIRITLGYSINNEVHKPMNEETLKKIINNSPETAGNFHVDLYPPNNQIRAMQKFFESDNNEKYNIGNILFWGDGYLIVGTPFNFLDIISIKTGRKVGNIIINEINDIIAYNISEKIDDPEYGSSFIMRDNKGKIQYIRSATISDKLNYRIIEGDDCFNDLRDDDKLTHILFSTKFYLIYSLVSYLIPLIAAITAHSSHENSAGEITYYDIFTIYAIYAILGIWFKGCVYDIKDESHTKRTCTKITIVICLVMKVTANSALSYKFCKENKTGIIFVSMLCGVYIINLIFNGIIYCFEIKFLLRIYWLGFLFYQLSRFFILVFFILSIIFKVNHIETYIYAFILCIILAYMFMANYFNTLMKNIMYNSYLQAIFNYPMEWMNLFCCCCRNPKECIKEIDIICCCCDSFFLACFQVMIYIMLCYLLVIYYIICACFGVGCGNNN